MNESKSGNFFELNHWYLKKIKISIKIMKKKRKRDISQRKKKKGRIILVMEKRKY